MTAPDTIYVTPNLPTYVLVTGSQERLRDEDIPYDRRDIVEQLQLERDELVELLRRAVDAWLYEASQGDGIMEEHAQLLADIRANLGHSDGDSTHTCTGDVVDGTCEACGREWAKGGQDERA